MLKNWLYFSLLLYLFSCNEGEVNMSAQPIQNYTSKTIAFGEGDGYLINPHTGDSTRPIITQNKDTLNPGKPGILTPTALTINPEDLPLKHGVTINSYALNSITTQANLDTQLSFNKHTDSLKVTTAVDSNKVFINSTGDTVITGIPLEIIGKKMFCSEPIITEAQDLKYKTAFNQNFGYLDIDAGLNSSFTLCIKQDKAENIWIGTKNSGLVVYNGSNFKAYDLADKFGSNTIWDIEEDNNGNLWFATSGGGVIKYDGINFIHFSGKQGFLDNVVISISKDNYGNLWFGTLNRGVSKYDGKYFTNYTTNEGLNGNSIWCVFQDSKDNYWFGTNASGAGRMKDGAFNHYTEEDGFTGNTVRSIIEDNYGNIWFATTNGIGKWSINSNNIETITNYRSINSIGDRTTLSAFKDHEGNLWFGKNSNGIMKIIPNENNGLDSVVNYNSTNGLSGNSIWEITEDKQHNLWIATGDGGINCFKANRFEHINSTNFPINNQTLSVYNAKDQSIWIGTAQNLYQIKGNTLNICTFADENKTESVRTITMDKFGNLWFGSNYGIYCYDGINFYDYTGKYGLPITQFMSSYYDTNGVLWFGSNNSGLFRVTLGNEGEIETIDNYDESSGILNHSIYGITEDDNSNIWINTNNGASKFTPSDSLGRSGALKHYNTQQGLSDNTIFTLKITSDNSIWLGTAKGLNQISKNNAGQETITVYGEKKGLLGDYIWSILEDKDSNIWVSTRKGVSLIQFNETDTVILNYTKKEGLNGIDTESNSAIIDHNNVAWFGTHKGITKINLSEIYINETPPKIELSAIEINEIKYNYLTDKDSILKNIKYDSVQVFNHIPLNLDLTHKKNHLTFKYNGIDWSSPTQIQYAHRLVGLTNKWSVTSYNNTADYRNLSYGTYTFQVAAIGQSGKWSAPISYSFNIRPPWWHTWWTRALFGMTFILLIYLFIGSRTKKLRKQQKLLENEIALATGKIRLQKEEAEQQKTIIEKAHTEMTDSINYAKTIQQTILPSLSSVKQILNNFFIFYQPKDIVTGDFYWVNQKEDLTMFAVADCTGHGVPGALVSVICNNALNRSVNEFNYKIPGQILDKTREIVSQEFENVENQLRDGMDIAFCCLNGNTLSFSGAQNPVWIIRKGKESVINEGLTHNYYPQQGFTLIELKGNKQPIGKFIKPQPFNTQSIKLIKGDLIYLFSDGYADQFGGEKHKKFKIKNLRELLINHAHKDINQQYDSVKVAFDEWKGNAEQVDDICLMGIQFDG